MHYYAIESSSSLEHHGIKGMRWGVRRYQDYDGHRIGSKKLKPKPRLFGLFNKKNKSRTDLGSKVPEENDKASKYKDYEEALSKDGWTRNDTYAFGDSTNFEKKIKIGGNEVLIEARCDRSESPADFKTRITTVSAAIAKNNGSIKANIAKEVYKEFKDMGLTRGITEDQFSKGLTVSFMSLEKQLNEVSYEDSTGLYGDHFFTAEVDDKGKYYRYSMNG